jgi:hypothetical protein
MKTVAIVGASTHRHKFGNKAVRAFAQRGFAVIPIHPTAQGIEGHRAYRSLRDVPGPIDMATFYVPPAVGMTVMADVAAKGIPEVWLNPGSESDPLVAHARALGIEPIVACSILAIGESPSAY